MMVLFAPPPYHQSPYAADINMEGTAGGGILMRQGGSLVGLMALGSTSDSLRPWAESYLAGQ